MKNETMDLVVIEKNDLVTVFKKDGLNPIIAKIKDKYAGLVADISTKEGRQALKSGAFEVAKYKTRIVKAGADLNKEIKLESEEIMARAKAVRDEAKRAETILTDLAAEIRKPLTDWEKAEKERVAEIRQKIDHIKSFSNPLDNVKSSAELIKIIDELKPPNSDDYNEFKDGAIIEYENSIRALESQLSLAKEREALEAERLRLKAEQEEREREERDKKLVADTLKEAEKRIRNEANLKAQNERDAAKKAEWEANERAKRAELKLKQEQAQREEEERKKKEAEEKKMANRKYVQGVLGEVKQSLMGFGVDPETAYKIVVAIYKKEIPKLEIKF